MTKTFTISVEELFTVYYNIEAKNEEEAKERLQKHLNQYLSTDDPEIPEGLERTDHIFKSASVNNLIK